MLYLWAVKEFDEPIVDSLYFFYLGVFAQSFNLVFKNTLLHFISVKKEYYQSFNGIQK